METETTEVQVDSSEELNISPAVPTEETEVTPESNETPTPVSSVEDELLQKAVQKGYNPNKEEFIKNGGHPDDFKSAKQWLEHGELLDNLHQLKRKVETQQKQIQTVVEISKKAQEAQKERLIRELKQKQREAAEIADLDAVERYTDEISKASTPSVDETQSIVQAEFQEKLDSFKSRNRSWINDEPENFKLRKEASEYATMLEATQPHLTLDQKLERIERMIKATYPERFENKKQFTPPPVATNTVSSGELKNISNKKLDINTLPPDLRLIAKSLTKDLHEQYIKDCQAAGLI